MRVIILVLFVSMFAVTPVYLLNTYVMPELMGLKDAYTNMDARAAKLVDTVPSL